MTIKKAILILGSGAIILLMVLHLSNTFNIKRAGNYLDHHYILDMGFSGKTAPSILPEGARLPDATVPEDALAFFRAMERNFAERSVADLDNHFKKVGEYIHTMFNPADAQRLFVLYKNYLNCEINISNKNEFKPKSAAPREILLTLYNIQNYRRQRLGRKNADALFGAEVKAREYLLRQSLILDAHGLYGTEKETLLQTLRTEMWGDQIPPSDQSRTGYDRYQLKLQLYREDLSELNESERKQKIDGFRRECFSDEVIGRLEAADRQLADEHEKLEQYRLAEQQINTDGTIGQEEKTNKIKILQDVFFGSDAEAFRRRQAIYEEAGNRKN